TVTDLGIGSITATAANGSTVAVDHGSLSGWLGNQALSLEANGSPIVSISNGQGMYPFSVSPVTSLTPNQGIMADFPLADPAPVNRGDTYGNPRNAYSLVETSLMNPNGIVAAIDSAGVYGHSGWNTIYYSQRNSDGSWGSPVVMWRGSTQFGQGPVIG